jgi:hypothetical protein
VSAEIEYASGHNAKYPAYPLGQRVLPLATLLMAFAIAACATHPPARAPAERAADAALAHEVWLALNADPELYSRHVDISVDRGVVRLGGYVWSADDFRLARNDAQGVPGVKSVAVQMELLRGGMNK